MKQTGIAQPVIYNDLWGLIGIVGAGLLASVLVLWMAVVQSPFFSIEQSEPPALRTTIVYQARPGNSSAVARVLPNQGAPRAVIQR